VRKVLTIFIAIACLLGQGTVLAARMADLERWKEDLHAAQHASEAPHHHHDDGSVEFGDSGDSSHHTHAPDSLGNAPVAFLVAAIAVESPAVSVRHLNGDDRARAPPFLDGLRRPPRPVS
jgi:hypothetical protein